MTAPAFRGAAAIVGVTDAVSPTGELDIRGKVVLNAAGPWGERLLTLGMGLHLNPALTYSRDAYFVVARAVTIFANSPISVSSL